jgi:hypothetical protein
MRVDPRKSSGGRCTWTAGASCATGSGTLATMARTGTAIRERYAPLVEHVAHRADLDYIFGELAGELNAGHIYVKQRTTCRQSTAARRHARRAGRAHESGYFRIAHIYPGENWHEYYRSPLTEAGVTARSRATSSWPWTASARAAWITSTAAGEQGRPWWCASMNSGRCRTRRARVDVKTVTSEVNLRYLDWVTKTAARARAFRAAASATSTCRTPPSRAIASCSRACWPRRVATR